MSEPQFAYSGLNLDELRSMAASPQVGTMQAMPQSFHALADRVGEVADLLSHAQADLPNWWRGPAAEQAAATLGRAAAEAREFHGSALAAASAVSRCVQVVAEQQHQMMNVPDVPTPAVTDVVQRPTTPFEALEAARQDATYQAAHEQAVQVVNGIAAQYVETRDALATITTTRGENFDAPMPVHRTFGSSATGLSNGEMVSKELRATTGSQSSRALHEPVTKSPAADEVVTNRRRALAYYPNKQSASSERELRPPVTQALKSDPRKDSPVRTLDPVTDKPISIKTPDSQTKNKKQPQDAIDIVTNAEVALERSDREYDLSEGSRSLQTQKFRGGLTNPRQHRLHGDLNTNDFGNVGLFQEKDSSDRAARINPWNSGEMDHTPLASGDTSASPLPWPTDHSQIDKSDDASSTIIPPYNVGPAGRSRERSIRPSYLKERKSAWLSDKVAAPADGVIGPDWLEHP